jgi:hypothetical protein
VKLIRSLDALERRAAGVPSRSSRKGKRGASRAPAGATVGMVWTADEVPLGRPLASGEFLAVDVYRLPDANPHLLSGWQRTVERATLNPRDRGNVYDVDGVLVGRVVSRNGSLVTTRLDAGSARA